MMDVGVVGSSLSIGARRRRSAEERRLIVEETLDAGASVARVAMKHGVNANQVFKWKRLHEAGSLGSRLRGRSNSYRSKSLKNNK